MPVLTAPEGTLPAVMPPAPVPPKPDFDPETKIARLPKRTAFNRRVPIKLSEDDRVKVVEVMGKVYQEWEENTSQLETKLLRIQNTIEGIRGSKTFPWDSSSNLHIPLIEIHLASLVAITNQTQLDTDRIWRITTEGVGSANSVASDIEGWLNLTCRDRLSIPESLRGIHYATYRDGTAAGVLDWVSRLKRRYDVRTYTDIDSFQTDFPDPDSAGVSAETYDAFLQEIGIDGELSIKVTELVEEYKGPELRVVELKNFVVVPVASPALEYAQFVGDRFIQRADFFRQRVREGSYDSEQVEEMLKGAGLTSAPDRIARAQDLIEGIGRNRIVKADEFLCIQGNLRIDLDGDGVEENYPLTYNPQTKRVLQMEEFPYLHNRQNYIAWRFDPRPGRLRGLSIWDKLSDINEEIDTQHNQRIDSRTISTVPSFKKLDTVDFDPTRKDQQFFPGVTFKVRRMGDIEQFNIRQTDLGTSIQEENNLMSLADMVMGIPAGVRSGQTLARDPRASGRKIDTLINESNTRVNDYLKELAVGTQEVARQIIDLYYQFGEDQIGVPRQDAKTGVVVQAQIERMKLRDPSLIIRVDKTSLSDNPDIRSQMAMVKYDLWAKEPLIGQNMKRRRNLVHRTMSDMREKDIEEILPSEEQLLAEIAGQQGMTAPGAPAPVQALGQTLMEQGGRRTEPDGKRQGSSDTSLGSLPGGSE